MEDKKCNQVVKIATFCTKIGLKARLKGIRATNHDSSRGFRDSSREIGDRSRLLEFISGAPRLHISITLEKFWLQRYLHLLMPLQ